jgi:hypothetical protein
MRRTNMNDELESGYIINADHMADYIADAKNREQYEGEKEAKKFKKRTKKQVERFKGMTPDEAIKELGKEVEEAEKKYSKHLRKLRGIEKETKQIRAMMIEEGTARLKKTKDMDELELRALQLAKIKERKQMKYGFFKGAPRLLMNDERISPGAKAVFALLVTALPSLSPVF